MADDYTTIVAEIAVATEVVTATLDVRAITGERAMERITVGFYPQCGVLRGEHSLYGRIWRVHGDGLVTEYGVVGSEVDCAQLWLRKIPPDTPPPSSATSRREAVA